MNTKNDGGSAFPVQYSGHRIDAGMSLRDWFAGQALAGMSQVCGWQGGDFVRMSAYAYEAADAMLKAREVSP